LRQVGPDELGEANRAFKIYLPGALLEHVVACELLAVYIRIISPD
jgi:hypothetical protein